MNKAGGVGVVYKDLILLGRRTEYVDGKRIPFGGYWAIFGGSCGEKENPMICAIRELKEETQIDIEFHNIIYSRSIHNEDNIFNVYFTELDYQPDITLNEEHTEYGWFGIDELDRFPYDIDPRLVEVIQKYKKYRYTL